LQVLQYKRLKINNFCVVIRCDWVKDNNAYSRKETVQAINAYQSFLPNIPPKKIPINAKL